MHSIGRTVALLAVAGWLLSAGPRADAGGSEGAKPGQVLRTLSPVAAIVRDRPDFAAARVAMLPQATPLVVEEVRPRGWLRVRKDDVPIGWVRASQVGASTPPSASTSDALVLASETIDADEVEAFVRAGYLAGGGPVRRGPLKDAALAGEAPKPRRAKRLDMSRLAPPLPVGNDARTQRLVDALMAHLEAALARLDPSEEDRLGRERAAAAIAQGGLDRDPSRRAYVQLVTQAIVRTTKRLSPTVSGYHVDVLGSGAAEPFVAIGGFLALARGELQGCRDEDEVAGLVARELARIEGKHAEQRARADAQWRAALDMMRASVDAPDSHPDGALQRLFDDFAAASLDKNRTLRERLDAEADLYGSYLLAETGFDFWALRDVYRRTAEDPAGTPVESARMKQRAAALETSLRRTYGPYPYPKARAARAARFRAWIGDVR